MQKQRQIQPQTPNRLQNPKVPRQMMQQRRSLKLRTRKSLISKYVTRALHSRLPNAISIADSQPLVIPKANIPSLLSRTDTSAPSPTSATFKNVRSATSSQRATSPSRNSQPTSSNRSIILTALYHLYRQKRLTPTPPLPRIHHLQIQIKAILPKPLSHPTETF